jgi:3-oxoacyl-[acyl-carrier-protein] synthase-3
MAIFKYSGIGISGISAAAPKEKYNNLVHNDFFTEEEVKSIVNKTGIKERRVASSNICASDLCYFAAKQLLKEMVIDINTIDVLIFISQTADYRMPATSIILQDRLGLPNTCAAFDINLGCSGYVYGLSLAFSLCTHNTIRKVLLLNGETRTKVYSFKDKSTGLLFGDAGAATLIERNKDAGESIFSLNSDGSRYQSIMIPAGGYRYPSSSETVKEKVFDDGSIRTDEQGIMDGSSVFGFAIQEVPWDITRVLHESGKAINDIDIFLFHQANKFIVDHIAKKMGIPLEKVPYSLDKFGNTSSVSIPLNIVSELSYQLSNEVKTVLMTGFGVGLSWATGLLNLNKPYISQLIEI